MSVFIETKNYFRQLCNWHLKLAGNFVHGGTKELRAAILSSKKYPLLLLDTPFIDIKDNGSATFGKAKSDFTVVMAAPNVHKTEEEIDDLWEEAEEICMDIISKLKKDAKAKLHTVDISELDMTPIDPLLIDGCIGWRIEFTLGRQIDICYKPENWD
jgi:hypothetical protein